MQQIDISAKSPSQIKKESENDLETSRLPEKCEKRSALFLTFCFVGGRQVISNRTRARLRFPTVGVRYRQVQRPRLHRATSPPAISAL